MVSHDICKVQLTHATDGLSTHVVEGNFVSYQIASSLFRAGGAQPHSIRSSVHWIATAPSQPKQMGSCSTTVRLVYHMGPIQPITCVT